jgi:hypothetical protein
MLAGYCNIERDQPLWAQPLAERAQLLGYSLPPACLILCVANLLIAADYSEERNHRFVSLLHDLYLTFAVSDRLRGRDHDVSVGYGRPWSSKSRARSFMTWRTPAR